MRYGDLDAPSAGNAIDDPANRLLKVMDATNDPSGFADDSDGVTDAADDYAYDSFGNMTSDENKGITSIRYNHLNLPTEIQFTGGNFILYRYNALGQKVYKRTREAGVFTTVDYLDGFQYQNGILQFFPTSEGYVRCTKVGTANFFNYVYQYRDHLGNIRMNFAVDPETDELKILEESHYYPFGLKHMNYSGGKLEFRELNADVVLRAAAAPGNDAKPLGYNYKYQEQEWQDELGLNWYSFKYRNYDPAIGRFMNIDPLTEKYVDWGPYVFSGNRVIDARELEGLEPNILYDTHEEMEDNYGEQYNGLAIRMDGEIGARKYRVKIGDGYKYAYTLPVTAGPGSGAVDTYMSGPILIEGGEDVGGIHTHDADDNTITLDADGYPDNLTNQPSPPDILYAGRTKTGEKNPTYEHDTVITANGSKFHYGPTDDPNKGNRIKRERGGKDLPSDPGSTTRRGAISPNRTPVKLPIGINKDDFPLLPEPSKK